ncbi:MAG: ammonia channel protein, partial [Alphaproteobacteria bacterium]
MSASALQNSATAALAALTGAAVADRASAPDAGARDGMAPSAFSALLAPADAAAAPADAAT